LAVKEEKRNEILKAALKVISESGFDGAKIEDIAKEAGIGKGTVYEYFDSKNTLFVEMVRYTVERYQDGLEQALAGGNSLSSKLRNLSRFYANFMSKHVDIASSSMSGQAFPEEMRIEMMKSFATILRTIEEVVREAIRSSELRTNIDPEMATSVILGGLKQYTMKKIYMDRMRPEEIDHDGIVQIILNGLV
jgi:AcrR family transcriptional regulator